MRPRSRGHVRLASADPFAPPRILFNHLADAEDRAEVRDGIHLTREVVSSDLYAFARRKAETSHHPSCTCRMGPDDLSVGDEEGRVHGLEGLRVVDASIMPNVVSSNINAPTIMMAEKIADRIRSRAALLAETVGTYRAENFRHSQR
jgi:choline dehydrogenase